MCVKTIFLFKLLLKTVFSIFQNVFSFLYLIVLVMEPFGEMSLRSCKVKLLQDWYTFFQVFRILILMDFLETLIVNYYHQIDQCLIIILFQNPNPNYKETLHCTQEAVYPMYTMIFIFYALCGILMLLFRPLLSSKVKIHSNHYSMCNKNY